MVKIRNKLAALLLWITLGNYFCLVAVAQDDGNNEKPLPLSHREYSFGYWLNGMRKHDGDASSDKLCIETGYFGLALDMAQLNKVWFSPLSDRLGYEGALALDQDRMKALDKGILNIEIETGGKVYRAASCRAGDQSIKKRLQSARLWESARYVQNYDLQDLVFKDKNGKQLITNANLNVITWPDSLNLTLEVAPGIDYQDGEEEGIRGKGRAIINRPVVIKHKPELEHENFTLETWVKIPESYFSGNRGWLICKNGNDATEGNYGLSIYQGQLIGRMTVGGRGASSGYDIRTSHHTLLPDRWHHLAMSYDGKTMKLYVDGKLQGTQVISKKRVLGKGVLSIGQRADGKGNVVAAVVDQVCVSNRALSSGEIKSHARNPNKRVNGQGLVYVNEFEVAGKLSRQTWGNAKLRMMLKGTNHTWETSAKIEKSWQVGEVKKLTLNCPLTSQSKKTEEAKIVAKMPLNGLLSVNYDQEFGCHVAKIVKPKRNWKTGYTDIRNYDEIDLLVSAENERVVPFLLDMVGPANVTGVSAVLCNEEGVPTGIPVQVSKNWHEQSIGSYLRAYALLPASKGGKKYKLRLVYGFYGSVPSASHGQLCLVGYGGNGRWDQLAIGCWGETFCMDLDMSLVDVTITDIRMLMARVGKSGRKWSWTDAGWGGDWLGLSDTKNRKHYLSGIKTAYLAHGPCLTEVKYDGFYGAEREVDFFSTVRTLRTDDFARTFTTIRYSFEKTVSAEGWLFKMGRTNGYVTPVIAYGNGAGLIRQHQVPDGIKQGDEFLPKTTLEGKGPWWVSFPGAYNKDSKKKNKGSGYRAMVIRSYKVKSGEKVYTQPAISFPGYKSSGNNLSNLDFLIKAPEGVSQFEPGDTIELDVEWITLPRVADDYYGPNEHFRKHITDNPSSWKTTYRAAAGNDLLVKVTGGKLMKNYPIIIKSNSHETKVNISGGVGFVPIRFEGLKNVTNLRLYQLVDGKEVALDQSVHGNDFWQTDYDAKTGTFKVTYNLPLDGVKNSQWILRSGNP